MLSTTLEWLIRRAIATAASKKTVQGIVQSEADATMAGKPAQDAGEVKLGATRDVYAGDASECAMSVSSQPERLFCWQVAM